jgi:excinuclease ABC subunit B
MHTRVQAYEADGKFLQAQRIKERTLNDIEMLSTLGYCSGIENYSIYFDGRQGGEAPTTLLDYFPDDALTFVDESHITLSQIGAMYNGDHSRKSTLIEYGFRLPSALNNRPLKINEFYTKQDQLVYVSATPGDFELGKKYTIAKEEIKLRLANPSKIQIAEAIIRPTGLLDPEIVVKPVTNQVDDVLEQVRQRVAKGQRVLITTLTKKFAEELDIYFKQINVKSAYIHSDIDTMQRVDIIADLRRGVYDVLIGINLLREGLDLPEVSLVAIFDADKEGFLRSRTSLIQIVGRAARHENGLVIMYGDRVTGSMKEAIEETNRRREIQKDYNTQHNIVPSSTTRQLQTIADDLRKDIDENQNFGKAGAVYTTHGFEEINEQLAEQMTKPNLTENPSVHGPEKIDKRRNARKATQVYTDFNATKETLVEQLTTANYTEAKLDRLLDRAIKESNFEMAAAIRDILDNN